MLENVHSLSLKFTSSVWDRNVFVCFEEKLKETINSVSILTHFDFLGEDLFLEQINTKQIPKMVLLLFVNVGVFL